MLRGELAELKRCQVQYFTLAVTGTGVILGFAGTLTHSDILGPSRFAPLAIILPSWWIFFDKATSISRIVGYVRVLESVLWRDGPAGCPWTGFEQALKLYRIAEEPSPPSRLKSVVKLVFLGTRHRYWMISLYTFLGLAVLCCLFGWLFFPPGQSRRGIWVGVAAVITFVSLFYNLWVVWQLTFGRYSYDYNEAFWREVLDRRESLTGLNS